MTPCRLSSVLMQTLHVAMIFQATRDAKVNKSVANWLLEKARLSLPFFTWKNRSKALISWIQSPTKRQSLTMPRFCLNVSDTQKPPAMSGEPPWFEVFYAEGGAAAKVVCVSKYSRRDFLTALAFTMPIEAR